MISEAMVQSAKVVMADTFKFYLRAHGYHWNVEGLDFLEYHQLFEKIYTEVFDSLDTIAEEIRGMGVHVPASFGRFNELSSLDEEREQPKAIDMVQRLLVENAKVLANIQVAYAAAEEAGNFGFSNLMAERQSAHHKHGWMLRATLS